jgi:hypothetical protein
MSRDAQNPGYHVSTWAYLLSLSQFKPVFRGHSTIVSGLPHFFVLSTTGLLNELY